MSFVDINALDALLRDPPEIRRRVRSEISDNEREVRPSDVFNATFSEGQVLEWLDFTPSHSDYTGEHWVRPDKDGRDGASATIYDDEDGSHVTIWSDTVQGWYPSLELRRPYDAFGLFVNTFFKGDFATASASLVAEGFGESLSAEGSELLDEIAADIARAAEDQPVLTSWAPIDIAANLDGATDPPPELFERIDGVFLLYRGRIHAFQGEPESGKSWGGQAAIVEVIERGGRAAMFDFENSFTSVRDRLLALGLSRDLLTRSFDYIRPSEGLSEAAYGDLTNAVGSSYDLIVVDGVTDAMALLGLDPTNLKDAGTFDRTLLRLLADSGAAVVVIDHVVKSAEGRGRWAIGSQHKLAAITGASFLFEKIHEFGRGMKGMSRLVIKKDKPGMLRQEARGDVIAEFWLDGTDPACVTFDLKLPSEQSQSYAATAYNMEVLCNYISMNPGERKRTILTMCGSTAEPGYLEAAFDKLQGQGYIANDLGDKNCWRVKKAFHEVDGIVSQPQLISDVEKDKRMDNLRANPRYSAFVGQDDESLSAKIVDNPDNEWADRL
jgi:hypothetical protein